MQCRAREERPGRKTDLLDAEWLVHLLECGLLRGWLIPPADIKAARDVIRYRRKLVEHRTSKLQRLGNVLQDAGIKADSVASSVTPKSVRAMVEALIDGERRTVPKSGGSRVAIQFSYSCATVRHWARTW